MTPAWAHPSQHGTPDGHLAGTGPWGDLELVGEAALTSVDDLVADVGVDPSGDYAYLANWGRADCSANSEAGGQNPDAGVHVVDIQDLANLRQVGFIPRLLRDRFPVAEHVARVDVPTVVVLGTRDRIVPAQQSRRVARAAAGPTRLVEATGADHNGPDLLDGPELVRAVSDLASPARGPHEARATTDRAGRRSARPAATPSPPRPAP